MKTLNSKWTVFSCCGLLAANWGQAQDWPQWRGPARDAKAASFFAPKTWPKELTQKWKVAVGDGVASPSLVGSKLFVFARQEGAEILRCLDAADGKELWKAQYDSLGATGPASGYSGPRATPTVAEGKVVTLGVRGVLSCYDAADGKLLWRKDDLKGTPRFFTSASPVVSDGLCVAEMGGADDGAVVACELGSGKEKWKWTGDSPAYASPMLMTVGGTKLAVVMTEAKVMALGLADGKAVWEVPFAAQRMGYNAATPLIDGQTLIYSGSGRGTTAVKIEKKGDSFAATELWKNPEASVMFNTPVLKNGTLYGLSAGNEFFCLNAADGKSAWTAPVSAQAADAGGGGGRGGRSRGGYGSIVDAGSVLLALSPSGELIALEPNPKQYTELARIKVAETPTYAYPVASGSRIFIKDKDSVTLWALP